MIVALIYMCKLASVSSQFDCRDEHSAAFQKIMNVPAFIRKAAKVQQGHEYLLC